MSQRGLTELLNTCRTLTLVTLGSDGWPHAVPMWFAPHNDSVHFMTYRRSQKCRNIDRDNRVVCVLEAGQQYTELRGAQIRGHAEELTATHERWPAACAIAARYSDGRPLDLNEVTRQMPSRRIYRVAQIDISTWDHRKLAATSHIRFAAR